MSVTYKQIRSDEEIGLLIEQGNGILNELGYTEHSRKHAAKVADTAGKDIKGAGIREAQDRAWPHRGIYARHRKQREPA